MAGVRKLDDVTEFFTR